MNKNIVTIKDVAEACGVSSTAVSLVLNNRKTNISLKTQAKIRAMAEELDYQPNHAAFSLVTKKTNTVGIIIPDISNAFFSESVRTIQIELSKYGYGLFLCNSEEKFENDVKYIKLFANRNVDGVIITMSSESMQEEKQKIISKLLAKYQIPYVLFDRYYTGEHSKVFVDNLTGGYDVAKHLIDFGHKDIGVITGPLTLNSSKDRLLGVKKAMEEVGLELKEEFIIKGKYDMESGRIGANKLLGKVSAIFAFNDLQAYGVIETAKQRGLKIPDDISVVGFDDIFYSTILDTKLTTVRQPISEMSKKMCELLMHMMENKQISDSIPMQATLIQRDSVKRLDGRE